MRGIGDDGGIGDERIKDEGESGMTGIGDDGIVNYGILMKMTGV